METNLIKQLEAKKKDYDDWEEVLFQKVEYLTLDTKSIIMERLNNEDTVNSFEHWFDNTAKKKCCKSFDVLVQEWWEFDQACTFQCNDMARQNMLDAFLEYARKTGISENIDNFNIFKTSYPNIFRALA